MNSKRRIKQIMAYVYMPLFFTLLGFSIVYIIVSPLLKTVSSVGSLMVSSSTPTFNNSKLESIYDETSEKSTAEAVDISEVTMPGYATHYAMISCDTIGLKAPVFFGDNNEILQNGVGQYIGSSAPGFGSPILLVAHNTTYFLPLQNIQIGDIITISTNYGTYNYSITGTRIAHKNDTSAYDLKQQSEQLIMYTCYPFNLLGTLEDRFFVYGDKISGPDISY